MRKNTLFVLLPLILGGCVSMESMAPRVTSPLVAAKYGVSLETLDEGRRIFTTTCIACHSIQPIENHSVTEWKSIVATMAPRSNLDAKREAAVMAYITAAHPAAHPVAHPAAQ